MVFWINSTRKAVNCTQLRLMQLFPALLVLSIPNTTANHAITCTYIMCKLVRKCTINDQGNAKFISSQPKSKQRQRKTFEIGGSNCLYACVSYTPMHYTLWGQLPTPPFCSTAYGKGYNPHFNGHNICIGVSCSPALPKMHVSQSKSPSN